MKRKIFKKRRLLRGYYETLTLGGSGSSSVNLNENPADHMAAENDIITGPEQGRNSIVSHDEGQSGGTLDPTAERVLGRLERGRSGSDISHLGAPVTDTDEEGVDENNEPFNATSVRDLITSRVGNERQVTTDQGISWGVEVKSEQVTSGSGSNGRQGTETTIEFTGAGAEFLEDIVHLEVSPQGNIVDSGVLEGESSHDISGDYIIGGIRSIFDGSSSEASAPSPMGGPPQTSGQNLPDFNSDAMSSAQREIIVDTVQGRNRKFTAEGQEQPANPEYQQVEFLARQMHTKSSGGRIDSRLTDPVAAFRDRLARTSDYSEAIELFEAAARRQRPYRDGIDPLGPHDLWEFALDAKYSDPQTMRDTLEALLEPAEGEDLSADIQSTDEAIEGLLALTGDEQLVRDGEGTLLRYKQVGNGMGEELDSLQHDMHGDLRAGAEIAAMQDEIAAMETALTEEATEEEVTAQRAQKTALIEEGTTLVTQRRELSTELRGFETELAAIEDPEENADEVTRLEGEIERVRGELELVNTRIGEIEEEIEPLQYVVIPEQLAVRQSDYEQRLDEIMVAGGDRYQEEGITAHSLVTLYRQEEIADDIMDAQEVVDIAQDHEASFSEALRLQKGISRMERQISSDQEKLAELADSLGTDHPRYIRREGQLSTKQTELDSLQSQYDSVRSSFSNEDGFEDETDTIVFLDSGQTDRESIRAHRERLEARSSRAQTDLGTLDDEYATLERDGHHQARDAKMDELGQRMLDYPSEVQDAIQTGDINRLDGLFNQRDEGGELKYNENEFTSERGPAGETAWDEHKPLARIQEGAQDIKTTYEGINSTVSEVKNSIQAVSDIRDAWDTLFNLDEDNGVEQRTKDFKTDLAARRTARQTEIAGIDIATAIGNTAKAVQAFKPQQQTAAQKWMTDQLSNDTGKRTEARKKIAESNFFDFDSTKDDEERRARYEAEQARVQADTAQFKANNKV